MSILLEIAIRMDRMGMFPGGGNGNQLNGVCRTMGPKKRKAF